uniref:CSD domain-containing protein n=1 Tax=Alexandrium andersonii TaxID=327968 RepID=A0A7S2ALD1_9DINO|mmetsp:Transcript_14555/g.33066  ORF Transcript_14555/g.33066 Transcript_14555/m.33066 type:complete len:175 (+) Transcript_14555:149-673(+)
MSWYTKQPPPKPDWDVCWDFSKKGQRGGGGQWQGGRGRGKSGGWQNWEEPWPWWMAQQAWPQMAWWPQYAGQGAMQDVAVIPPSLEKRLQESGKEVVPPPPDKDFEGSLKSMSARHGYGFIVCGESHRLYGRDVYLPADQVPEGAEVRDRLRFRITLSAKGHPQAANVSIAGKV